MSFVYGGMIGAGATQIGIHFHSFGIGVSIWLISFGMLIAIMDNR